MPLAIIFDTHFSRLYMHDALLTTLKSTLNTNLSDYTPKTSHQPNEQAVLVDPAPDVGSGLEHEGAGHI